MIAQASILARLRLLLPALLLASLLLCPTDTIAAVISQVESGTAISSGNGVVTVNLATPVEPTRAFLMFSSRHDNNTPGGSMLRGEINNLGTQVVFTRATNQTNTISIQWYVAEFTSGVSVQRGEFTQTAAVNDIGAGQGFAGVADIDQAFVTWSKTPNTTDGDYSGDDPVYCDLTTTTNLQCRVQALNVNHTVAWQVIEFTTPGDINVQRNTITGGAMTGGTTTLNEAIPVAVDVNNTMILVGYTTNGGGADVGSRMLRAQLTSPTNIQIDRSVSGDTIDEIGWQAIEFFDGTTVQRGTENFTTASGTASDMSWTHTGANRTAHAVVSVAPSGGTITAVTSGQGNVADGTTVQFNINGDGSNKLMVGISVEEPDTECATDATINTATYDGAALTLVPGSEIRTDSSGFCMRSQMWYVDNPSAGSSQLSIITQGTTRAVNVAAVMLNNAAAGDPENVATNSNNTGTNAITTSINTLTANAMLVDIVGNGNTGDYTPGAGQTEQEEVDGNSSMASLSTKVVATPVTFNETLNTVTINTVELTRAMAFASVQPVGGQNMGRSDYLSDDVIGVGSYTTTLTSATELTLERTTAVANSDVGWFVVEFPEPPMTEIILSTTNNSTLGGQAIDQDEAVQYDGVTGTLFLDEATFANNENLTGLHAIDDGSGNILLTTTGDAVIDGVAFGDDDIVRISPTGTAGVYDSTVIIFDGGTNFTNANEDIDAVYQRDNGNIILSTTGGAALPACGGGNLGFADDDLVEWDVTNTCATFFLDTSAAAGGDLIPNAGGDEDITGVHLLYDDPNLILFSLTNNNTIRGVPVLDGDVVLYDVAADTASIFFSESEFGTDEDVNAVSIAVPVVVNAVDHYEIDFPVTPAVTCEALEVDITAHQDAVDHSLLIAPTAGTVLTVTANVVTPADVVWIEGTGGNGSLVATGPGQAQYTFNGAETSVKLFLSYPNAETGVSVDVVDSNGAAEFASPPPDEDPNVDFVLAAFRFLDTTDAVIGTQIAGKPSNIAPGNQTLQLRSVRTNTTTLECEAPLNGTGIPVEFAYECNDPASCAITTDGLSLTAAETQLVDDVGTGFTSINMDFVGGVAEFFFSYNDVGDITLRAQKTLAADPAATPPTTATTLEGNASFVVRPFGFDIDSSGLRAADWLDNNALDDSTGTNLSYAADADGSVFVRAGNSSNTFPVTIRSILWESADDADNDGVPDTGANLTDNSATPNFGEETSTELVNVTVGNVRPTNMGTLFFGVNLDFSSSSGTLTTNLAFDEVGIIDLTASLASGNYLGGSVNATATHQDFGRFIPDRFVVTSNTPVLESACVAGNFTYMDESFYYGVGNEPAITITAVSENGDTTLNYGDGGTAATDYWKLPTTLTRVYLDNGVNNGATFTDTLAATVNATGTDDFDGVGVFTVSNITTDQDAFLFDRASIDLNAAEGAPFVADIDLQIAAASFTDTDTVCYDTGSGCQGFIISGISGTELRFGRLVIGTAAGSELIPVTVPFQTEYFDGANFIVNAADACTSIVVTDLNLVSGVEGPETDGTIDISNAPGCSGSGEATGAVSNSPFIDGIGELIFNLAAPPAGCTGFIDITPASLSTWLQFDWDDDDGNDDGPYDDFPIGRADFGIFEGPSEYIYIREPW